MPVKFSQFIVGPPPIMSGDIVVGLRNGTNTQFMYMPENNVYFEVVQDDNGFSVGQILRLDGSTYVLALADTFGDSSAVGIVTSIIDQNTFVLTMFGYVNPNISLVPGALYYLDPVVPGALTETAPVTYGQILKLVFIAATDTMGYFLNYEGIVVGTSGSGGVVVEVTQDAHGFTAGQAVRLSGETYVLALADNVVDAEAVGVVSLVIDVNTFLLSLAGEITGLSGLTAGNVYYVSQTTPGLLTDSEPTTTGQIEKPLMIANTPTSGFIFNLRGRIIPEAAIATNLEFSGNSIISTNTNGNIDLAPNGTGIVTSEASINLYNDSPLRWYNTANTFYNAFVANSTLASSTTWTLPTGDGASGYVLSTDGSGVLSFVANGGGGGSGSALTDAIAQTAHGFTVGQVVRLNGTVYVLAKADTGVDAEAVGIVSTVTDANNFILTTSGLVTGLSGLTAGSPYYVSPTTAGLLTSTEPTTTGQIEKPILIANTTTSGYVFNYRGRIIPEPYTPAAQSVYVNSNGSDSLGNGSVIAPYLTIGYALSTIVTSSSTNMFVVFIGPGTYSETGLNIPVWTFLQGSAQQATKIIDSSGAISINSSAYNNGSQRLGFANLDLINSTGITIDFQAIGGSGSNQVYLNNNQIVGPVIFRGRGSDDVTGFDNRYFGTYTSSAMQEVHFASYWANNAVFNTLGVTGVAVEPEFTGVNFYGNAEFTSSGSGNTMVATLIAAPVSGTLQVDQATTTVNADDVSLNAGTLSQTSGGIINYLDVAKYLGYTPAVSGNWPTVPVQAAAALDELAATGVMGPFTAGSVIFSNGTKLTQDNTSLNWNDANGTFHILQPSSVGTVQPVLVVTSDPAGAHGHGAHIAIDGNIAGGGTIFRTDNTATNDAWIQITGGDQSCTGGGTLYVNGNVASESGAPGCVQATLGLITSSYQFYDYTQSILLWQVDNAGVMQLPLLQASSAIGTDASHNIVPLTSVIGGWTVVTTNTAMVAGHGYITNSASQIILTLPATITVGSVFQVVNMNTGGFSIAQNAGQQVQVGVDKTTVGTGGSVSSQDNGDAINMVCNIANTNLIATPGTIGTLLIT